MPFEVYEPFSMALSVSSAISLRPGRESLALVLVLSDDIARRVTPVSASPGDMLCI